MNTSWNSLVGINDNKDKNTKHYTSLKDVVHKDKKNKVYNVNKATQVKSNEIRLSSNLFVRYYNVAVIQWMSDWAHKISTINKLINKYFSSNLFV